MSDNIDQLPEEGSAYLKPSTPARVFIYIGNNEAREKSVIEKPNDSDFYEYEPNPNKGGVIGFDLDRYKEACRQYEERLESLPRIKVYSPFAVTLKEGQEIVENVDFVFLDLKEEKFTSALTDTDYKSIFILPIDTPPTPAVKEEERSDAVEFAEWLVINCSEFPNNYDNPMMWIFSDGTYWTTNDLYELFKTRNK